MEQTPTFPTRRRSQRMWIWGMLLVLILVGGYKMATFEKIIEVSEEQAQTLLDTQVANYLTKHPESTIERAKIKFGNNLMSLDVVGGTTVTVKKYEPTLVSLSLYTVGDPDYRDGGIYFNTTEFNLDELALNGEDPLEIAKRQIAKLAESAPIVHDNLLNNEKLGRGMAWLRDKAGVDINVDGVASDAAIKTIEAGANDLVELYRQPAERFMESMVINILEHTPLYELGHNWKERAAMVALEDIGIQDGKFTATLTGMQVIISIVTFLLALMMALMLVLAVIGGAGSGGLLLSLSLIAAGPGS